jgi:fumarate hydratase subunit alpha/L(+)-tartrate dehydratase alpha subunit
VCQDTGIAVYHARVGEHFPLHPARIYEALRDGTARATLEHPLRSNAVHTITRENTGPNIGHRLPIVHWEFVPDWDGLDVKCVPKGSGSENMSFLKMCVPADGVKGIKQFVLESIVGAGGKPCPPGIVGVGIGGSADYAMYLAKEAIMRPIGTRNRRSDRRAARGRAVRPPERDRHRARWGLGGDVTVLPVPHRARDTHMTLNPVAVNYQCWAARRASRTSRPDGERRLRPGVLDGAARGHLSDHRSGRDHEAPAGDDVTGAGPHHRHPRPHAVPHLRPGRRAADGPARRVPAHTAPNVRKVGRGQYEKICIGTTTSARMVRFTEPLGAQYGVRAICGKGGFPTRRSSRCSGSGWSTSRSSAARRARDDADRGDRGGRLGGAHARVPLEVPRQGLRAR